VITVGLFGLIGLAGALAAQRVGARHDRGWSMATTGVGWVLVLVAFDLTGVAPRGHVSLVVLVVALVLLDVAIQGLKSLNATRLFAVAGDARSRVNTAMVTTNFVAGAVGSALRRLCGRPGAGRPSPQPGRQQTATRCRRQRPGTTITRIAQG